MDFRRDPYLASAILAMFFVFLIIIIAFISRTECPSGICPDEEIPEEPKQQEPEEEPEKESDEESEEEAEKADYYVATNGDDENPGTFEQPFRTWQKAFDTAEPGDLVYIRGGIYMPSETSGGGSGNGVFVSKSGTKENPIRVFAYPGETPILDGEKLTSSNLHVGIAFDNADYWHIKGLTVRNVPSSRSVAWAAIGFSFEDSDNNIIENSVSYGNAGPGFAIDGNNNLFLNCDAHSNYDSNVGGENADGFIIGNVDSRYINTFRGCRSYNNSDDGFDTYGYEGIAIYEHCWAFNNGYGSSGDGAGFKLGRTELASLNTPQKILTNCIAYNSKGNGYDLSSGNIKVNIFNSVSYKMGGGFYFRNGANSPSEFRNNIAHENTYYAGIFQSNMIRTNNSWQGDVLVDDDDFISLDGSQLSRKRKADGSLPDITFLKLKADSDLINKGTNVGLPYSGRAPDIGAFEYVQNK